MQARAGATDEMLSKEARPSARELAAAWAAFLALTALMRYDAWRLPGYIDEVGYYLPHAFSAFKNGFRIGNEFGSIYPYHTPLFQLFQAALAMILGWKAETIRLSAYLASATFISGSYALARLSFDRARSALVALAVLFMPVTLSQAALAHVDLPMAALFTWALYLLATGRAALSSFFFAAAALTNGTVLVLAPSLLVLLWPGRSTWRDLAAFARRAIAYFSPCIVGLALWLVYRHSVEGNWLGAGTDGNGAAVLSQGPLFVAKRFAHRVVQIFLDDGRFLLALPIAAFLALRRRPSRLELACMIGLAIETVFLSLVGFTHQRYFLVVMPMLAFLGASAISFAFAKRASVIANATLALAAGLGLIFWLGPPGRFSSEEYRRVYREHVEILQEAVSVARPDLPTISVWPMTHALQWPFVGYARQKLPVINLYSLSIDELEAKVVKGQAKLVLLVQNGANRPELLEASIALARSRGCPEKSTPSGLWTLWRCR